MSWARFLRGSLRAGGILPSAARRILRLILPRHHLHGHQSRDEYCQVELSRQGFADGKRARDRPHRRDVSVANRGEGHKAVVNPVANIGHLSRLPDGKIPDAPTLQYGRRAPSRFRTAGRPRWRPGYASASPVPRETTPATAELARSPESPPVTTHRSIAVRQMSE